MLKREDIKNGTLVFDMGEKKYGIINDVGNAMEKGDRSVSSAHADELSYTIVDILTDKIEEGICEHSSMTTEFLSVATKRDVEIYLTTLEADALMELAEAKKELAVISDAMNRLSKY